jgi:serine/threonine-protein kinase HipA
MKEPGVIQYLRMFLHSPQGGRIHIGVASQYGDVMRMSFNESYINNPDRLTLSMQFQGVNDEQTQQILRSQRDVRLVCNNGRWPSYLANLLPEGHNRERLAQERGCESEDDFELLAAAGHDLTGALEVEPYHVGEEIPMEVRHWHTAMGLDELESGFVEMPVLDAFAIAGVVTKFSAIKDGRRYVVKRHGAAGSHIIKLPTTTHPDLALNEYMGYMLCDDLGLNCAKAELATPVDIDLPEEVDFKTVLIVERFDREPGRRVHMEEFAQAMAITPNKKYGTGLISDYGRMLRLINERSVSPVQDVDEFLGRMVAFILMGNTDAHLKNWALIYKDGVHPALAPLYDPVCVSSFFAGVGANTYAQNRQIDKTLCAFGWDRFEELIDAAGLNRKTRLLQKCREHVKRAKANWPALMNDFPTPAAVKNEIIDRLRGKVAIAAA